MRDIRQTIRDQKPGTPVYGLSMGDDVQYYGGYNPQLERQIREALGSSEMRLFSVIGNHDQDGKSLYKRNGRKTSDLPTIPSTVAMSTMYASTIVSSPRARPIIAWRTACLTDAMAQTRPRAHPQNKKVILCYHIPFTFGNAPYRKANPLA